MLVNNTKLYYPNRYTLNLRQFLQSELLTTCLESLGFYLNFSLYTYNYTLLSKLLSFALGSIPH